MASLSQRMFGFLAVVCLGGLVAGCGTVSDPARATVALPKIAGGVHGGQQPVSGATVSLYVTNTTTQMGASTLLGSVASGLDGSFNFDLTYANCPANSYVYLVATGGNPGLSGTVNNGQLAEMAMLGLCDPSLSSLYVNMNELTTVAAVQAMAPFMADYRHVGMAAANFGGLAGAFRDYSSIVSTSTGALATPANGVTQPALLLNTLADILAACVNTAGGTSAGDGSVCEELLSYAPSNTTNDTISAMLAITSNPSQNVPALYGLITGAPPFVPYLGAAPTDFTTVTVITLPVAAGTSYNYTQMTIDLSQRVWLYSPAAMPLATPAAPAGSIAVYYNYGTLQFVVNAGTAGLTSPSQLAPDAGGKVWALNSNGTLSDFLIDGAEDVIVEDVVNIPPFNGSPDSTPAGNGPVVGTNMVIDPSENVWVNYDFSCYIKFDSSEAVVLDPVTPTQDCPKLNMYAVPGTMATDEHGNIYIFAQNSSFVGGVFTNGIYKLDNSGNLLSPAAGYQPPGVSSVNSLITNMTFDRVNDVLWMRNNTGSNPLYAMKADGTPISGANGITMPYGLFAFQSMAVDGAGNLWVADDLTNTLHEFSPTGTILTPNGSGPGQSGLHPAGLNFPGPIAVDAYGNIWIANWGNNTLLKIPGLAVPKTYQ